VADNYYGQVHHLAANGTELWKGGSFSDPQSISVNPTDGSCWVADVSYDHVVHLGADGAELGRSGGFDWPESVSVNSSDGSVWVADTYNSQVVHLAHPRFSDVPFSYWAYSQIDACYTAGIVQGYSDGTYKPTDPVTRDQMGVYISRALAGGDDAVPAGPATATFSDVPTDYWAFKYV
jgi:hypothetical protein